MSEVTETVQELASVEQNALNALDQLTTLAELGQWHSRYLGNKGVIRALLNNISNLPKADRADYGLHVNRLKNRLITASETVESQLREAALMAEVEAGTLDITLPGRKNQRGRYHPSTITLRRFYHIWAQMGFQLYSSREVEDEAHNFDLLNFPKDHPARDMQDTFYTTEEDVVLRSQTSPAQIRAMREYGANGTKPLRFLLPGMVYRYEDMTVRNDIQFHQVEGLAIGRNIHMSDLRGTLHEFAKQMWGENVRTRFRNSYFPFVEPGMETDVECYLCGGDGCRVCKYSGWIEIGGSGMVHPNVLKNGGYDPLQWSGFAFGLGVERMNLNLYDVRDIRLFWQNDLRLLEQF